MAEVVVDEEALVQAVAGPQAEAQQRHRRELIRLSREFHRQLLPFRLQPLVGVADAEISRRFQRSGRRDEEAFSSRGILLPKRNDGADYLPVSIRGAALRLQAISCFRALSRGCLSIAPTQVSNFSISTRI